MALFSKCSDKLDNSSHEAVKAVVCDKFKVKSRFPLHVETSMHEIAIEIDQVAQNKFDTKCKALFVGGGVLKPLKSLFLDFFTQCGLTSIITALFKSKLKINSMDNDFQYIAELKKNEDYHVLLNEGLVGTLARKINWELINKTQFHEELKALKRLSKKRSKDSYLNHVFREHPQFENKENLAVKAMGFAKANDVANQFYFRNLQSDESSYDCFIPVGDLSKINSFCIDISNIDSSLYLESLLGKQMLLQAIMDTNFALLYSDSNHAANERDFTRTICHLSRKGRLFGSGWLAKTYKALKEKSLERKCQLSKMLAAQIISRAEDHHRSPLQALIVMTFNASVILIDMDPTLEDEVQNLWQEIEKHLNKFQKEPHDPLVEMIQLFMCKSGCLFQDLYVQLQISSMLMQHSDKGVYRSLPTQSEDRLSTQILIQFSENDLDFVTLFFPYALSQSIEKMQKLTNKENTFKPIHDCITSGSDLVLGINQSPLRCYREDPRRQFLEKS